MCAKTDESLPPEAQIAIFSPFLKTLVELIA